MFVEMVVWWKTRGPGETTPRYAVAMGILVSSQDLYVLQASCVSSCIVGPLCTACSVRSSGSAWLRALFVLRFESILPRVHRQDHPPACRLSFPGLQGFLYFLTLSLPSFFYSFSLNSLSLLLSMTDSHCCSTQSPRDNALRVWFFFFTPV